MNGDLKHSNQSNQNKDRLIEGWLSTKDPLWAFDEPAFHVI